MLRFTTGVLCGIAATVAWALSRATDVPPTTVVDPHDVLDLDVPPSCGSHGYVPTLSVVRGDRPTT